MQTADGGVQDGDGTSDQLTITLESDPDGVRIVLVGEVDLATAPELDRVLDRLVSDGHGRLLIDLHGVAFMDSTGLAAIMRALQTADVNGHRLAVRRGSPQVQRLFELTGFVDRLAFED
jgi:anti-sigma B factor antagonist